MAEIVQSMFGLSPGEINAQRNAQNQAEAMAQANLDPFARANMMGYRAGGLLGGAAAKSLGMVDPAIEEAKQREETLRGVDMTSPDGLMIAAKRAGERGDARMQMQLQMLANNRQEELLKEDYTKAQAEQLRRVNPMSIIEGGIDPMSKRPVLVDPRTGERVFTGREYEGFNPVSNTGAGAKIENQKPKDLLALSNMDDTLTSMINSADAISKHPGLKLGTGVTALSRHVPDTPAYELGNLVSEFKDKVKVAGLELIRGGGSIGALTEKEWPIIEGMVAAIDPYAGEETVKSQMKKVTAKMAELRNNNVGKYEMQWDEKYQHLQAQEPRTNQVQGQKRVKFSDLP